jgi:hypothetical protein
MPPKRMGLTILSGNHSGYNIPAPKSTPQSVAQSSKPTLSGPMIGRIHFAKPGCGSCGRH